MGALKEKDMASWTGCLTTTEMLLDDELNSMFEKLFLEIPMYKSELEDNNYRSWNYSIFIITRSLPSK